jgi:competence protein ComEC
VSAWRTPVAAAAFALGLFLWPAVGNLAPVAGWLVCGLSAVVAGLRLAPPIASRRGPLEEAGLAEPEEPAIDALSGATLAPRRAPAWMPPICVALGLLLAGVAWGGFHQHRTEGALVRRLAPTQVTVEGTLRVDPESQERGWSAVLDVSLVRWGDRAARIDESVWVAGYDEAPVAVRGDRLRLTGMLRWPDDPGFAGSLLRRGIGAELLADRTERIGPSSSPLVRAAQSFRAFVGRSIGRLFPAREAGLLMGLALGDDSRLDEELARDFHATGLGHLLVVSGENVAMVLAPVIALGLVLRLGRVARFATGLGTVVFFVVLTGAEPSVMRAGVMAGIALIGALLGRPRSAGVALAGAVLILLVIDPALVWAIGFQLSVAATAGMVALASPLAERLAFLPRALALATGATLAAQLGVTPVLLYHFHEVPLVTLPANVLAFPAVSPALLLGLIAASLGVASPALGRPVAMLAILPMRYLEMLADRLSTAPVPWVTSKGGLVVLGVGFTIVMLVAWWFRGKRRIPRAALVVAFGLLLPGFVWSSALGAGPPAALTVRFIDVGQGDAALITSPGGAEVLIDAGPDEQLVATALSALGVKRLDVAVATHPHADHIAGFPAVFGRFPIGLVLDPGCDEPSPSYEAFLRAVEQERLPVRHPRAGETVIVGDLRLDVLAPIACAHGTASDPNNDSLVIRVSLGDDVVLFPADAEVPSQQMMLDEGVPLEADVLKVPHHGGDTSLPEFFDAVDPEVAVVSVGQPNDYGHPVPEVLDEIRATGAALYRTDELGDVVVTFRDEAVLIASAG